MIYGIWYMTGIKWCIGLYDTAWRLPSWRILYILNHMYQVFGVPGHTTHIDVLDLAHFGGHPRYILAPLIPSHPVIAEENIICWGTFLNFFAFFAFLTFFFSFFSRFLVFLLNVRLMFLIIYSSTTRIAQHSTAQSPCTKQQTKYVPIRVHKKSMYVHACGVQVVFLEHGALGFCKSPVRSQNVGPSTTSVIPFHSSLWASVAGGFSLYEQSMPSLIIDISTASTAQHSTAQHSVITPAQSTKPSTCWSEYV